MIDRRSAPRIPPPQPMKVKLKTALTARVVDISCSGVQVELNYSLPPRAHCDLRLQTDSGEVWLKGVVRRCAVLGYTEEGGKRVLAYRAGLAFENSSREVAELLGPKIPALFDKPKPASARTDKGSKGAHGDLAVTIDVVHDGTDPDPDKG
jgi:hypothetical protein